MQEQSDTIVMPAHSRSFTDAPGRSTKEVGRRLALLRRLRDLDQKQMAKSVGVSQGTYSNWETGARPLGITSANAICDQYDVTLDWLYRGNRGTLPFPIEKALRELTGGSNTTR